MKKTKSAYTLRMRAETQRMNARAEDVVVYRWGRIVGALVIGLLILATFAFLVWAWLGVPDGSENETRLVAAGKIVSEPEESPRPAPSETPERIALVEPDKPAVAERSEGSSKDATPGGPDTEKPTASKVEADKEQPPAFIIDDPADQPEPVDDPALTKHVPETISEPNVSEPNPEETDSGSGLANVQIESDHLLRAQLTPAIQNREPTASLPHNVSMGSDDLIKVYFFTELEGLKGQTVFYNWYLDDQRMAQVPVRVQLDRMRASTSKNINGSMLGQWRVEAVTGEGDTLGSGQFSVIE